MATAETKKENDLFTCPICLETLKSPRSLPCLHTFCEQCISEYILSAERKAEHKISNYPCPVCRTLVTPIKPDDDTSKWASLLPHNFTISSLMETKTKKKQECHLCKRQEKETQATGWCRECSEAFCGQCCKLHSLVKTCMSHKVVKIEDLCTDEYEVDLSAISVVCPVHSTKAIEVYCFDHKQLCCVLCLTLKHRNCEKVQAIEEIPNVQECGSETESFQTELSKIESAVEKLRNEKQHEHELLKNCFSNMEDTAVQSVKKAKDKLDELLALFQKELSITRDDHMTKSIGILDSIDKLSNRVKEMIKITKIVRDFGSSVQLFIYQEKLKQELHLKVEETVKFLRQAKEAEATCNIDETIFKICNINTLGKIIDVEKHNKSFREFAAQVLKPIRMFEAISLKKKISIFLSGKSIYGGVCVSDRFVISTGSGKVVDLVDVNTRNILESLPVGGSDAKRLMFDEVNETLYISCYSGYMYSVPFSRNSNKFGSIATIKQLGDYNGGICNHDGFLYVIVGSEVKKMDLSKKVGLQSCFKTNTNCTDLQGLAVYRKNKRLVHTTRDFKVVCTSFDGTEIFSYKDEHMKKVTSVTVNSYGLIFAGEEEGSVHVISEDGTQRKTILEKPENIKRLCDVWLDKSGKTLLICGNEYIEMYDILYRTY